jgi:hypothetical protein
VRHVPTMLALASAVMILAACGRPSAEVEVPETPGAIHYDCFGVRATAAEIAEAPEISELDDHPGADAFAAKTDDLDGWLAVAIADDRLGAIRPLDPPDVLDGEVRDHERLVVEILGRPGDGEADAEGWMVTSAGPCTLRAELDGLGTATVLLDPDAPPAEDDTSLSLWVVEGACASGRPATDRVATSVEESAGAIRLVVGVEPLQGDQTCPANPPTPITLDLDEPIGERQLMDAARLPPIELEQAPPELSVDR